MAPRKLDISRDGNIYYARLPRGMYISVDQNTGKSEVARKGKGEPLPGKALIDYPKEGWSDPPSSVMRIISAALAVLTCMEKTKRGKNNGKQ